MILRKLFYLFIFLSLASSSITYPLDKAVRGCDHWGLYAEFLWVLNHLEWCLSTNKVPVIYWGSESAYYSPRGYNGSHNVWEYFFEPVSHLRYKKGDHIYKNLFYRKDFTTISFYAVFVDRLYLLPEEDLETCIQIPGHDYNIDQFNGQRNQYPVCSKHWYDKEFRRFVKQHLIDPFVKVKPSIRAKIDDFYRKKMVGKKTVGIHLRGRHLYGEVIPCACRTIFEAANQWASLGYQFLIATDQQNLLDRAKRELKGAYMHTLQREQIIRQPLPDLINLRHSKVKMF